MDVRQLKALVDEMNSARSAYVSAQWQLAREITTNYRDLMELIDAGVVKPCIPMSMLKDIVRK